MHTCIVEGSGGLYVQALASLLQYTLDEFYILYTNVHIHDKIHHDRTYFSTQDF